MDKIDACRSLANSCYNEHYKGDKIQFTDLSKQAKKYLGDAGGVISADKAGKAYVEAHKDLIKAAKAYENYKLKDHYLDGEINIGKKKSLNEDDRRKLSVTQQILENEKSQRQSITRKPVMPIK